jgi:hypothetical protein
MGTLNVGCVMTSAFSLPQRSCGHRGQHIIRAKMFALLQAVRPLWELGQNHYRKFLFLRT